MLRTHKIYYQNEITITTLKFHKVQVLNSHLLFYRTDVKFRMEKNTDGSPTDGVFSDPFYIFMERFGNETQIYKVIPIVTVLQNTLASISNASLKKENVRLIQLQVHCVTLMFFGV